MLIQVLPKLGAMEAGAALPPVNSASEDSWAVIHLFQGAADGACGQYCLLMSLGILGVESPDDLRNIAGAHHRKPLGRLRKAMANESFITGTWSKDLGRMIRAAYDTRVAFDIWRKPDPSLTHFILGHHALGHPVIVGLYGEELAHWVLVVGTWTRQSGATWLLVLDASMPASPNCPWNGIIALSGGEGEYPHLYGDDQPVRFGDALAMWARS